MRAGADHLTNTNAQKRESILISKRIARQPLQGNTTGNR